MHVRFMLRARSSAASRTASGHNESIAKLKVGATDGDDCDWLHVDDDSNASARQPARRCALSSRMCVVIPNADDSIDILEDGCNSAKKCLISQTRLRSWRKYGALDSERALSEICTANVMRNHDRCVLRRLPPCRAAPAAALSVRLPRRRREPRDDSRQKHARLAGRRARTARVARRLAHRPRARLCLERASLCPSSSGRWEFPACARGAARCRRRGPPAPRGFRSRCRRCRSARVEEVAHPVPRRSGSSST